MRGSLIPRLGFEGSLLIFLPQIFLPDSFGSREQAGLGMRGSSKASENVVREIFGIFEDCRGIFGVLSGTFWRFAGNLWWMIRNL